MFKSILNKVNRAVAVIIVTLMCMTMFVSIPANAETGVTVFNYDNYSVEYNVVNEWDGYQNIEIKLINTSTEPIYNWALKYDAGGEVTNIWNGIVFDNAGTNYIIKNAGYNYELMPNASVNFGYTLKGNNLTVPNNFENCAKRLNLTDGYNVQIIVEDKWENGFTGYIEVVNVSDIPLEAWNMSFNTNFDIIDLWNANMSQSNENSYTVSSQIMSNPIQPNASVKIGISANLSNDVIPTITDSTMSIVQIDKTTLNGNNEDKIITNDSDDLVGTIYFKDISSMGDLVFDSEGNCYVRNQILLTANDDVSYDTVSALAESMNAKIVGYIELTNDYQIEFNSDLSIDEINSLVYELSAKSMFELVTPNTASINTCLSFPKDKKNTISNTGRTIATNNWNIYAINAHKTWDYYINPRADIPTSTVKIGALDSFFLDSHEDMNYKKLWNNPSSEEVINNKNRHGTAVAGIIGATFDNKIESVAGICPKTEFYGFSIYGNKLKEIKYTSIMEWKYALALMIGNNVKVINISMKPNDDLVNNSKSIENLLSKLLDKGYDFLIVSAAGNDTKDVANASSYFNKIDKSSPVYNHIIVVGAIDFYSYGWTKEDADKTFAYDQINDKADMEYVLCNFSNYGNRMDIVAPGELITTLDIIANQPYCNNFEGTSAAAPHVAGVAGLVYSVNPYLTGAQVKEIIINSAKNSAKSDPNRLITKTVIDGKNTITYSYPLLDAKAAVDEAINRRVYGPPVVIPVDKDYAIVYGDVTDTLGGYIEEAKILVTSKETSEQQTFYTDNDGNYVLTLNPGTYDIKFSTGSAGPFGGWFLGNDYAYHTIKNKTILANDAYPLDVELDNKAVKSVGVFDSNGYPIDYIGVTVTNTTSNEKYETTINSDGILYNGVDDGIYTIDLSKDGYLPKTLDVEVKDETIFDEDGNVLNQIFLDPIEVTISGTVTEYDRTTKETKPLKNFKVAIYQQTEGVTGDSIIASGTTSSDGTYKITFNQQGDFVVKFSENKQVPISVYNGKYTVDMQFELDDEEYTVIDDLSDGIWCQTDKGYYIKIYTTDNTGKYTQTLVPESWGTSTYAIHRWNKELKMATYNSSGNLINDRTLDYFYDESDIYFNDINDKYKIDEITSINITSTGLTYTIHSHGFYKSKTNFIGSISYYKEEWEKDNVTTVSFYNNSQKISMSTQSPF